MVISGQFVKWIYRREDNGYTVAVFEVAGEKKDNDEVTVIGYLPKLNRDIGYQLTGEYVEHPRYGMQFKISSLCVMPVSDRAQLVSLLAGPKFKGIGRKTAELIADTFGNEALTVIRNNPDCLKALPQLNPKRRQVIIEGAASQDDDKYAYLTSHHLTMKQIMQLQHFYGDNMMNALSQNPYDMALRVDGIGFATADKFALSTGGSLNSVQRLTALAGSMLMEWCMRSGDSYMMLAEFEDKIVKLLPDIDFDMAEVVDMLQKSETAVVEEDRIYTISQYKAEKYIAQYLSLFPSQGFAPVDSGIIDKKIEEVEEELGIVYQEKQKEAIEAFFANDLLILTGGPGTGKTTIVRGMVKLCHYLYPQYNVTLGAPTGRAAKRLSQLTGGEAKTLHSLLRWDLETNTFGKNEEDPLNVDLLIIDEFSMVDQWLLYNLFKAGAQFKKLILIGDKDQLPSVGMGCVLADMINVGLFKVVKLEKIYRQQEGSDIIKLANQIKNDECEAIPDKKDIRFFECGPYDVRRLILEIVSHGLENYEDISEGLMNIQVVAPKYAGINGIDALNVALQKTFNPPAADKPELTMGYRIFRQGDKILQLKNQTDDDVFNGDIGILIDVIAAKYDENHQNRLVVDFEGTIVEYTAETFMNITHAYCISIHKAQGSEYPLVIMPVVSEYGIMLQKKLIYTAVTRANRHLIMIGSHQAFFTGISRNDYDKRRTTLQQRLIQYSDNGMTD